MTLMTQFRPRKSSSLANKLGRPAARTRFYPALSGLCHTFPDLVGKGQAEIQLFKTADRMVRINPAS
jgi:hypothetical protein